MKTRAILPAFLLSLFICSSAFPRIGETEAQIEQRYGKWIPPMTSGALPMKMYKHADLLIGVVYIGGRSEAEYYRKEDKSTDLSDDEIQLLLQANSQGKTWSKIDSHDFQHDFWKRDSAISVHTKFVDPGFMVTSEVFEKMRAKVEKLSAAQKLSGF